MATERFRRRFQELKNALSEHSEKHHHLVRKAYSLFFERALNLPTIESQPQKHWTDYEEGEITFATINREDLKSISPDDQMLLGDIQHILGFGGPIRLAVFDVRDDKKDNHKGIYSHSASVVVESEHGRIFRGRIILHLNYKHSSRSEWWEKGIGYTPYGLVGAKEQKPKRASEIDLLLAANSLIQLYAERVTAQKAQVAKPTFASADNPPITVNVSELPGFLPEEG